MKLLFVSQGRTTVDHPGWKASLRRLQTEGVIETWVDLPWIGYGETHGWKGLYNHIVHLCEENKFDVVYFHYFHKYGVPSPAECIRALRLLKPRPIIVVSCGDGFNVHIYEPFHYPRNFRISATMADLVFSTQMGQAADAMQRWGAKNVVLTPNSLCPVRFKSYQTDPVKHRFDFDVVMIGSRNAMGRNPLFWHITAPRVRRKIAEALTRRFGKRLGLFGHHWDGFVSAQGPCSFDTQQETFRRGRIIVGGNPYSYCDYYSSNRLFFEVASGIPTVELRVPHLDKIFRDGDQVYFADSVDDIVAKCEWLLKQDPVELYDKASRAAAEVAEKHTQYHRMKFMLDVIRHYRDAGSIKGIEMPYFLPEGNMKEESQYAMRMSV